MILPYPLRLLCLSLATFFLAHLVLGMLVWLAAPAAIGMAERIRTRAAARLLLSMRLFPLAGSLFLVAGLCVPSYLWLEPEMADEAVGVACLAAAFLGLTILAISIHRALRAAARSLLYARRCQSAASRTYLAGEASPVWVIDRPDGSLALAGILRPRVFISQAVIDTLSAGQLAAALRHERAHQLSRDNLKRLFLLLAPEILPFSRYFEALDRGWTKFTEWSADDGAVAGDARRSLLLAAALVRVARLSPASHRSPLVIALLNHGLDLSARVDRLLRPASREIPARTLSVAAAGAMAAIFVSAVALMLQPATLAAAHGLFERLIR